MAAPMPGPSTKVRVTAEVHPTEDPDRVARAVRNLFPDAEVQLKDDELVAEASDLTRLRDLIEDQEIQDTARTQLLHSRQGDRLVFTLSKQPAYAGAVNFAVDRSPLGDLEVVVEADDVDVLVDRVAPATEVVEEEGAGETEGGPD